MTRPDLTHAPRRFDPSALLTPANLITLTRIAVSPFYIALVVATAPGWLVTALWIVLVMSDWVDGTLARKQGTTRSGAFLDPLADKVLVIGTMVALVAIDVMWWLPVALIAVRELVISVFRTVLGRRGISVPARNSAKAKTVAQELAVGWALLPLTADHRWIASSFLWLAVVLALVSAAQYLFDGSKAYMPAAGASDSARS
jgi:CDP-diacylglycerol--glycerol-3-phosphate 3-phosphatidyltransferase